MRANIGMNVYSVSAAPASTHVYLPAGPKLLNSPKAIVAHSAAEMPPASCDLLSVLVGAIDPDGTGDILEAYVFFFDQEIESRLGEQ